MNDNKLLAEYLGKTIVDVPGHIPSENIGTKKKPYWRERMRKKCDYRKIKIESKKK